MILYLFVTANQLSEETEKCGMERERIPIDPKSNKKI